MGGRVGTWWAPQTPTKRAAAVEPLPPVLCHADLVASHLHAADGRLVAIIDWGDAMAEDPHYELIQVFRDALGCDRELFGEFLDAAGWERPGDFARRTLAMALRRQAVGLEQHGRMDVFEPIAQRLDLAAIPTLDDLAHELFGAQPAGR